MAQEDARIGERGMMAHWMEVGPLNTLVLRAKLRELGRPHEPITMELLEECTKSIGTIMQCRKPAVFR